jgi:hypothetical protein
MEISHEDAIAMVKGESTGRLKKRVSDMLQRKLMRLLQNNTRLLKSPNPKLSSVGDMLEELVKEERNDAIRSQARDTRPEPGITRRTLEAWLKALRILGVADKVTDKKKRYYYYKTSSDPHFFLKKILEPELHEMKMDDGSFEFTGVPFAEAEETKGVHIIDATAALFGTQTKFFTRLPKVRKLEKTDLLERLANGIEWELRDQFKKVYRFQKGVKPGKQMIEISNEKLEKVKDKLKGMKLVFVYVLDGSKIWTEEIPARPEVTDSDK